MKLITKQNCEKCDWLKGKITGVDIIIIDERSIDGLALLAYNEFINPKTKFPILLDNNDEHIQTESVIEMRAIITNNCTPILPS